MKKSNQEESRRHNRRLVLNTIYTGGEISRVEISRRTRLTRTTVSGIVADFIESGLVEETGRAPSTGGKPATLLRLNENARLMVGIDLAESEFCGALVNLRGKIVTRRCLSVSEAGAADALQRVYQLIGQLLTQKTAPVIGIGVGVPGLMDPATGTVRQAVNLDWVDLPLGDLLRARFQLPVYIANDCQVAALGEYTFGGRRESKNLMVIKIGRGVGAGIVLDGHLFYGDNAGAGEIGHIQVAKAGERCRCGNSGCLETVISVPALIERARREISPEIEDLPALIAAQQRGDPRVTALLEDAAQTLGGVITHFVSILNINHILLAGSLRPLGDIFLPVLRQRVRSGVLPALAEDTRIQLAPLGDEIVILGAASLVLKNELGLL